MKEMMVRAGNSHLLTVLSYPNAGHLIEPPYSPLTRASAFRAVNTREKGALTSRRGDGEVKTLKFRWFQLPVVFAVIGLWGGETVAHSWAQEDAWRKVLVFLREHLYGDVRPSHQ